MARVFFLPDRDLYLTCFCNLLPYKQSAGPFSAWNYSLHELMLDLALPYSARSYLFLTLVSKSLPNSPAALVSSPELPRLPISEHQNNRHAHYGPI
jgi:hypothetical protein